MLSCMLNPSFSKVKSAGLVSCGGQNWPLDIRRETLSTQLLQSGSLQTVIPCFIFLRIILIRQSQKLLVKVQEYLPYIFNRCSSYSEISEVLEVTD